MNADLFRLVFALVGAVSVGAGAWMHYPPLGPVAFGTLLFSVAVVGAIRAGGGGRS
jgi:hypothetical protein